MVKNRVHVKIENIELEDGSRLDLNSNTILIVTGPNNAGKSTFLSEITKQYKDYGRKSFKGKIIKNAKKIYCGSAGDVAGFLSSVVDQGQEDEDYLRINYRHRYKIDGLMRSWEDGNLPFPVEEMFLASYDLTERLGMAYNKNDSVEQAADMMFYDEGLELDISATFKKAFGIDLILQRDRQRGVFRIGSRKDMPKHKDRLTRDFKLKIEKMEPVSNQGSGMRSFSRLAISMMSSWESLLVVDEPELFLHPPQMRHLAKMMCQNVGQDRQIVVATHDENFLRHILDFGSSRVKVIRIDRKSRNQVYQFWTQIQ